MHRASSTAVPTNFSTIQLEARMLQAQVSGMIHHRLNGVLPTLVAPLNHHPEPQEAGRGRRGSFYPSKD
jgi:hypothetical protein